MVLKNKADEKLLDTYDNERLPIARKLVRTTDRLFGITVSQNPFVLFWRVHVMPRLVALIPKEKHLLRFAFRLISQIGIHYRDGSLSRDASVGSFPRKAPRPGDRLPFVTFQENDKVVNLQDSVKAPAFHLLLFPGHENEEKIGALLQIFKEYDDVIKTNRIALTAGTKDLYRMFGVRREGYYLVRPDMYVGYRSNRFNEEYGKRFLQCIHLKERN